MPGCRVQMLTFWRGSHYNIPSSGIFGFRSALPWPSSLLPDHFPGNGFHECCSADDSLPCSFLCGPINHIKSCYSYKVAQVLTPMAAFSILLLPVPLPLFMSAWGHICKTSSQQIPNGRNDSALICTHLLPHIWFSCVLLINPSFHYKIPILWSYFQ